MEKADKDFADSSFLERPHLEGLLESAFKYPIVTIVAPHGYGKTASVARYMQKRNVSHSWLRIISTDNDVRCFWDSFLCAIATLLPNNDALAKTPFPEEAAQFVHFVGALNKVSSKDKPLTFILDDCENLESSQVIEFINQLVNSRLQHVYFVLIGNTKPFFEQLDISERRFQLTLEHLAFTREETRALLLQCNPDTSQAVIQNIYEESEGWPLPISLFCRQRPGKNVPFAFSIIEEIFEKHFFSQYNKALRQTLILLSVLPRFSLEIIQQIDLCPFEDTYTMIRQNFMVFYNTTITKTAKYRLHNMYRQFLNNKRPFVPPKKVYDVQIMAAQWFNEKGMLPLGAACYWSAEKYEAYVETITNILNEYDYIYNWQEALERLEYIHLMQKAQTPLLEYCIARIYIHMYNFASAEKYIDVFSEKTTHTPFPDKWGHLLAEGYRLRIAIRVFKGEPATPLVKEMMENVADPNKSHNAFSLFFSMQGVFFLPSNEKGQLDKLVHNLMDILSHKNSTNDDLFDGYDFLYLAEAFFFTHNLRMAQKYALVSLEHSQKHMHFDVLCQSYFLMMRLEVAAGNRHKALEHMQLINEVIRTYRVHWMQDFAECCTAWLNLKFNNLEAQPAWIEISLENAYHKGDLFIARKLLTQAHYYMLSRKFSECFDTLLHLESICSHHPMWGFKLVATIIKTWCFIELQDTKNAIDTFNEVYMTCYANNIVMPLVEFGDVAQYILNKMWGQTKYAWDMQWLGNVYKLARSYGKHLFTMQQAVQTATATPQNGKSAKTALTARELEILRLLAQGLTRNEIAKSVEISINGVKKHLGNIYTKLGAINSVDAIRLAYLTGII